MLFLSRLCLNINFAPVPLKLYKVSLLMVHCWSFSFANLVAPIGSVFWLWVLLTFSVPTRQAVDIRAAFQQLCGGLLFSLFPRTAPNCRTALPAGCDTAFAGRASVFFSIQA